VLTRAYLTTAMFKAYPHWLDLDNLVPGGIASVEDDVLADVLLAASDWAVGVVDDMPLHGHFVNGENVMGYVKTGGRAYVRPRHVPLRAITSMSWGADPSSMMAVSLPDGSMRVDDNKRVSWIPGGGAAAFNGPALQFGPRAIAPQKIWVTWSYLGGFPFALLSSPVISGATSITVDDPSSILPGDVLRCYDPGQSEAFTVAASYVPQVPTVPPTATSIPLAAAAASGHAAGTGVTGFPRKALQAVIAYGVAQLMREDVSAEEPSSPFGPAARTTAGGRGGQGSGLINDAYGWLQPYKPTLRS
jgi:hypothetical protein